MLFFYHKSPIDLMPSTLYNVSMKRLIIIFSLIFTFSLYGCVNAQNDQTQTLPPVTILPDQPQEPELAPDVNDTLEEELEEKKKKSYAVSKVNGLRIRTKPNNNSTTIGYLDQNDAIMIIETVNGYYKTTYKQKTAYVHADYCSVMEIDYYSEKVEKAIDLGSSLLGYPYVWGSQRYHWGNGVLNKNFVQGEYDCSALVLYIYYHSNSVILDVTSRAQSLNGKAVDRSNLSRGDLMFFTNASRKNKQGIERIGHVGIYFGNGYILHTASDHAVIEPISATRWSYYITARRVV